MSWVWEKVLLVVEVFHTQSFADSEFAAGIAGVTAGWAGSATTFMRSSTWFNSQKAILSAGERNTARQCQTSGIGAAGDVPAGALYTSKWGQKNSHPQVIPPSDSVRQHLVKPLKKRLWNTFERMLKNLDQRYYAHRVLRFGLWQQLLVLCWPWKVPPVTQWNTMLTHRSWSMLT